ncbi:MAG: hypothetical protein U1G07_25175 [Verrucomicrobiota bacterium]
MGRDYRQLLHELELYDGKLLERPRFVVATNGRNRRVSNLKKFKSRIRRTAQLLIAAGFDEGIDEFKQLIRGAIESRSPGLP